MLGRSQESYGHREGGEDVWKDGGGVGGVSEWRGVRGKGMLNSRDQAGRTRWGECVWGKAGGGRKKKGVGVGGGGVRELADPGR